ncbi:exonuclease SbcCD subunit D [Sporosarcina pasteurii]|uniref:Nuclease SbcCD subunit D n=1 Tax=Sporosarcina pasteurii TaxID=1474 RepID=A0A380C642_SPOPA|nr:exonuclease SbcCD subunit D [Sporosarcina pasteurii]MDS9471807.1 exonuclease SbcCD subunit D [Sporosarcina pasteurii]QBQ04601.1 exonuclease SbcCD subunit D [Sporosarcina pasteurii]SUJ13927.1 Nuclease sbcCD subunit D [Sporosarcina pasteurii]
MKIFHTADWHLGKLVQGVYMTEEQSYILEQFIEAIEEEQPDAVIIAGDLYDRAVPPTEAVALFDNVLKSIVVDLDVPVIAVAGNHDSPGRLQFGSQFMRENGYYIAGKMTKEIKPVILNDEFGEVHFHLVPFADPSVVRNLYDDAEITNHQSAMAKIMESISAKIDHKARHVFVGHAFVTPHGESEENTSDSERPIAIGGAEYVSARLFQPFHYTALGHLHQAHYVLNENIRYAGSPLKYSISEEHHNKGFFIVSLDGEGNTTIEKRDLIPRRDMRTVEGTIEEIETHPVSEDYVFVKLLDKTPVLYPMEKVRAIYPNAMHVERKIYASESKTIGTERKNSSQQTDMELFQSFYKEMKGEELDEETKKLFAEVLHEVMNEEGAEQ